jgi:hypothetical protein
LLLWLLINKIVFLFDFQIKQNSLDGGNVEPQSADENMQNIVDKTSVEPVDSNRAADNDLDGLDSGIAGSYRETSSDIASLEINRRCASYTDAADKLIARAEQANFLSTTIDRAGEGGLFTKETEGSEEDKEKFTTEAGMVSYVGRLLIAA